MIPISTDPADLVTLASTLTIGRYATTAGAVVWFYDYLLMFSAEFRYVLLKKWGLVKVLYLLVRISSSPPILPASTPMAF